MDKITRPTFVIITKAIRERIHRSPQIGTAHKITFPFRICGDLGLIIPAYLMKIEKVQKLPWGKGPPLKIDARHGGLWSAGPEKNDIPILMSKDGIGWGKLEKFDDYRLVWLGENEFEVLKEASETALVKEYTRFCKEKLSKDSKPEEKIRTHYRFLKAAITLYRDPFQICFESAARSISDEEVAIEAGLCRDLLDIDIRRRQSMAAAHTRMIGA